jgi:hypothetical protein
MATTIRMVDLRQHAADNGSVLCLQVLGVGGSTSEVLRRLDLLGDDFQPLAGEVRQSALCTGGTPPTRCHVRQQLARWFQVLYSEKTFLGRIDVCLSPTRWFVYHPLDDGLCFTRILLVLCESF